MVVRRIFYGLRKGVVCAFFFWLGSVVVVGRKIRILYCPNGLAAAWRRTRAHTSPSSPFPKTPFQLITCEEGVSAPPTYLPTVGTYRGAAIFKEEEEEEAGVEVSGCVLNYTITGCKLRFHENETIGGGGMRLRVLDVERDFLH